MHLYWSFSSDTMVVKGLIARDKVRRQYSQSTTFEEKGVVCLPAYNALQLGRGDSRTQLETWKQHCIKNGAIKEVSVSRASCITNSDYFLFRRCVKKNLLCATGVKWQTCVRRRCALCLTGQLIHFWQGQKRTENKANGWRNQTEMDEQKLSICPHRTNNHV